MRCYYKGIARDVLGNTVGSATVSVYLAGSSTAATIYQSLDGTTGVNSVTANNSGIYEFWVDRFDYDSSQKFKIITSRTGKTAITWDNLNIDSVVLGTYTISDDKELTTRIDVPYGVVFSIAEDKTLTVTGSITAGKYQIFSGDGAVVFDPVDWMCPWHWWGDATEAWLTSVFPEILELEGLMDEILEAIEDAGGTSDFVRMIILTIFMAIIDAGDD